jgi:hypothetical protein
VRQLFFLVALAASARAASSHVLPLGSARIEAQLDAPVDLGDAAVWQWIDNAARAVTAYYGRFPLPSARITVERFDGRGIGHGTAYPTGEVHVLIGRGTTAEQLAEDWVMTHEMLHLAFPSLPERNHWMEEGFATYVEPLARLRSGAITAERVWGDIVRDMWQGLPRAGDRGLDRTHTWGRTYWGGAIFFLMADIEMHQRTGKGLEEALRAIAFAGGTIANDWPIDKVIATGDRAVGAPVLRTVYDRMKAAPAPVDLDALWKKLGISVDKGRVSFDDSAPLAPIRRAISFGK